MPIIGRDFRVLRFLSLSGFAGDPDWVGDYDADAARVAGSMTCRPTQTGQVDVVFAYVTPSDELVGPEPSSTIDFSIIALGSGNINRVTVDAIYEFESKSNHVVDEITTLARKLAGSTVLAVRLTNLMTVPVTADRLAVSIRVG